ncbi:MAG: IS21 family transposase [Bacteroidota bacterium]
MQIIRTVLQLLQRKLSERSIAKELNVSRTTIRKYDDASKASGLPYQELLGMDDASLSEIIYPAAKPEAPPPVSDEQRLEAFEAKREYFLKELSRTGVTKQILWKEYLVEHPDGYKYTQFCERIRRYQQTKDVSLRIEYKPADVVMIDFAGDKLYTTDPQTGELIAYPVLVCVLPFSGYSYVEALPDASLPQLVKALNNCLAFFGGAPSSLITDNMRQMVTKACRYEPIFTDLIQAWAHHHNNIHLKATRVRSPRDKPHVENEVKVTYSRVYAPMRDQVYHTLPELNKAILRLLKRHHKQPFQKKEHNRIDLFTASEQPLLQSLPADRYVMKHSTKAKVQRDYHVFLGEDRHLYSVPFIHIGKTLKIIYDTDLVEIYLDYKRVAQHRRSYKKYGQTTTKEHMPEAHQAYHEQMGWNRDYFLKVSAKIGPCTRQYIERMIDSKPIKEQAYKGCVGLLRLADSHSKERVEAACKLALEQSNSIVYRTIANILLNNRDSAVDDANQTDLFPAHENLRGSEAYK